ncbi:MAG: helix-turn-helix domain-containing protein [Betaproteobacteria bacterium]|nr:helix-turn-helix domain-containing protein [Betaproteobacteria bacterium]
MNMDEIDGESKDVSQPGVEMPEGKNSNGPDVADRDEAKASLNGDAKAETVPVVEEKATVEEKEPAPKVLGPGAQLAAYRIAAGMEQEQVAASLKMTVRQVRELESDNYEVLHGVAISRGFVRAYAKMLQVDPEPLIAMFSKEEPASKQLDQIPRQSVSERLVQGRQPFGKKFKMGKTGLIILVVVLLVLVYGAYSMKWFSSDSLSFRKKAGPTAAATNRAASSLASPKMEASKVAVTEPEKMPALSEGAAGKEEKPAEEQPIPKAEDKAAVVPQAASPDVEKPVQPQLQSKEVKATEIQPKAVPAVLPNVLIVRFNGPSRVQILRMDSSLRNEFDGRAGDMQRIEIDEPVVLVVERAVNVEAEFRERPLVLKTARRNSEARVELK